MQSFLPLNLLSAPEAVAATANSGSTVEAQLPIATFAAVRPSIGLYLRVVAALMGTSQAVVAVTLHNVRSRLKKRLMELERGNHETR